ncbi:MAG: hypothetical protein ACD_22C00218G0001 [uncultured bacterium]|uniref:DUF4325 domain-containing protein n=1 Tax=candidate division WWE3 bacterium RBG_16_37_10 TaxID=1802610 RepID=A0A1F4V4K5_UNCKA|nr:MAG: hypothetical protein ACD_22C00218G0001 [uncultured bacterium]OGC52056.1 MAG: hypothetical protein A2W32_05420 [candidate division WWE3 bacterium RBG_16_37_10]
MKIELKKFGNILISRKDGKEALAAIHNTLSKLGDEELLEIDFLGVSTFTPSWADEFITPIKQKYGLKVILLNTSNPSVQATLELLETISKMQKV